MVSRQSYTPYQMEFTMLSDFSEEDLTGVMDVEQKHSRRGLPMTTVFVFVFLLYGLTLSAELCSTDTYGSYLEAFPMKCGNDCNEYKRWAVRKEK